MIGDMSRGNGGSTQKAWHAFCRHLYAFDSERIGVETMMMPSRNLKASFRGLGELDLLFSGKMKLGTRGLPLVFMIATKSLIAVGENMWIAMWIHEISTSQYSRI